MFEFMVQGRKIYKVQGFSFLYDFGNLKHRNWVLFEDGKKCLNVFLQKNCGAFLEGLKKCHRINEYLVFDKDKVWSMIDGAFQ